MCFVPRGSCVGNEYLVPRREFPETGGEVLVSYAGSQRREWDCFGVLAWSDHAV